MHTFFTTNSFKIIANPKKNILPLILLLLEFFVDRLRMESKSLYYPSSLLNYDALVKIIIMTSLFSLHADLHDAIINLHVSRGNFRPRILKKSPRN